MTLYNLISQYPNESFLVVGVISNVLLVLLTSALEAFKRSYMDKYQNKLIDDFNRVRMNVIVESNSSQKLLLANMQLLLPFYVANLMMFRLYYLIRYNGSFCVIGGIVAFDKYSIFNLIQYQFEER